MELLGRNSVLSSSGLNVGVSSEVLHLLLPVSTSRPQPGTTMSHVNV